MRYTFFEIENFKGVRHARLDLATPSSDARVYTLVGLNESGKTTLLEAIDRFQATSEEVSPKELAGWVAPDPQLLIPIADRANFNGKITIRCGIELDDDDVSAAQDHLRSVSNGYRLTDLDRQIEIADAYSYEDSRFTGRRSTWTGLAGTGLMRTGRVVRRLNYTSDKERWLALTAFLRDRLPTIWFFPNFLFDFPDKIFLEPIADEPVANSFYRGLFKDVLDSLNRGLTLDTHIIDRARSDEIADRENMQQVLLQASRHVTQSVVNSWNRIFANKPMTHKKIAIDLGEDEGENDDESRLWVRFRIEDSDGLFSIQDRSLGFRWFFVYLMLTTYRGRRKGENGDMLFLFDEPASNLHPTAQTALLASLGELSRDAVVIYTTHSHHLVNPEWLGNTFVIANAGLDDPDDISADFHAQRTDVQATPYRTFASQHPDQSQFFQPILDVLDYAPSQLEMVPEVVMVEGKTDFYLLSYFQQVFLDTDSDESLRFLPGGGAGTLDAPIQLYLGWCRPFVALLDSDKAGTAQAARYVDKFGPLISPHITLLADAAGLADAKGIESLLEAEDRLAFQRLVDAEAASYKKKTFGLGLQEALLTKRPVELSQLARDALANVCLHLAERLRTLSQASPGALAEKTP